MEQSRQFSRSMGRWLMALVLVMLTSLATKATSVEVRMNDIAGAAGTTVVIPVYVNCDQDMASFQIVFTTDLGVNPTKVEFSNRIDPSAQTFVNLNVGKFVAIYPGAYGTALRAGNGVIAEIYVDIPEDAEPGTYTMTLSEMEFVAVRVSGNNIEVIKPNDISATLTVRSFGTEAYACYTPSNTTLKFYYDNQRGSRTGTTYDLNTGTNDPLWFDDGTRASVTKVVFDSSFADARPKTTYRWFYYMQNLKSITGTSNLNTSEVTNMSYMFDSCEDLTSLDLSGFNTANVTDMRCMFYGCDNLATIYAGNEWSTAAVTYSANMFYDCTRLVGGQGTTYNENYIDKTWARLDGGPSNPGYLSEWKEAYACYTPSNTTLTFYYDNLRSTRVGTTHDLNTGNAVPGWFTSAIYSNVTRVVFNSTFADARPTTTHGWFNRMTKLTSITGMKEYLNTSAVNNMSNMFYSCSALTSLDLSGFNTANVTDMQSMFGGCSGLTSLNLSSFNTAQVTNMQNMFSSCLGLTSVDLSGLNTSSVTNMASMFFDCTGLTSLDLSGLNTSSVTNMIAMFSGCSSLTSVDLSGLNTAKVTNMSSMFRGCSSLTSVDLSGLNTAKVTNMESMFDFCSGLTSLDLSSFNTAKVTNMSSMFSRCSGLTSLDLSSFNTAKVTNMSSMFSRCSGLMTIYVSSGWTTTAVASSNAMFYDCTSLEGGQGTTYDINYTDAAYAHIDGGPSNPGYFTEKPAFQLGDVNRDGHIDVSDVTMLIGIVLNNSAGDLAVCDMNSDSKIDVSDVTALIAYVLSN